jgi:fermentation-respiration switch protein FrsA (DUF1100 family)
VTESTFTSMVDIAQDGSLVLPASFGLQARFASVEKIARAGAPVLLMHGLADDFVQPKYVDKLYDAAVEPKTKVVFPPSNHDGVPFDESAKYRSTVQGFLGLLPTP